MKINSVLFCVFLTAVKSRKDLFPDELLLELNIKNLGRETFHVYKENSIDDEHVPIITSTENEWHSRKNQVIGNYKDKNDRISISIEVFTENGQWIKKYFGSFMFQDKEYSLKPADQNINEGAIKNYYVDIDGILHVVSETDKIIQLENDLDLYQRPKRSKRYTRGHKKQALLEVLVVIDYSIYKVWFANNQNNKDKTISSLLAYYSHIIIGVNSKFETITTGKYNYGVQATGFYVAQTQEDSPTENPELKVGDKLNFHQVIVALPRWLSFRERKLPKYDNVAVFTNYKSTTGIVGRAILKGACMMYSTAVILDCGLYGTIDIATHEIAHSIGANHDGVGNSCSPRDHYIMTPVIEPFRPNHNLHTFSSCSIKAMDLNANKKEKSCLFEHGTPMNTEEHLRTKLGITYSVNDQCKQIEGPNSYFCSYGKETDENLCSIIHCYSEEKQRCKGVGYGAYEGTSCGNKQWCINKKCVRDNRAPSTKDVCIWGDSKEPLTYHGHDYLCSDFVSKRRACKLKFVSDRCCETCPKLISQYKDCPYGDEYDKCDQIIDSCHEAHIKKICCDTCR